jgi:hypothetical protein
MRRKTGITNEVVGKFLQMMHGGSNYDGQINQVSIWMQLIETIGIVLIFSIIMQTLEYNFETLKKYQNMALDIYPLTYKTQQIYLQNPASKFPIIAPSKNERNGAEYSYSCFIHTSPNNFENDATKKSTNSTLRHIFHKGSPSIYPLMAPGVFMKSDTNVLRIYHNSTKTWNNYIDIHNIPMDKWVHLVVMLKGNFLDIYVNGNLANRMKFDDVPKLNYSDFYLLYDFKNAKSTNSDSNMMLSDGPLDGYVSRVKYFAYALSYTQIDLLLREGPNKVTYEKKGSQLEQSTLQSGLFQGGLFQVNDLRVLNNHSGLGNY